MTEHSVIEAAKAQAEDLSHYIRDVTDDEVAHFRDKGWVHIRNFVAPELCEQVIDHYAKWSGLRWRDWPEDPAEQAEFRAVVDKFQKRPAWYFAIRQEDPWMFNYVTQRKFGEAAARLLGVPAIKPLSETLHVKYPSTTALGREVNWHQDFPSLPLDRAEACQFWLALVPITKEMGPMVHLSGSQNSKPGGLVGECMEDGKALYPELWDKYEVSEVEDYEQGDAMFHDSLTWHASGPNRTNKIRWAMSSYRMSARTRYTGQANFNTDGLGLTPRGLFDHPNFPTTYP